MVVYFRQEIGVLAYELHKKRYGMIYGYIRVSTNTQTTDNQKFEIEQFAKKNKE